MREASPFFIKKKHEYDRVKATASAVKTPFFTLLHSRVQLSEEPRVGIIVGRRVGNAVTRNRLKRIFREHVRASYSDMAMGHHCIVYPKIAILKSSFHEVQQAWQQTLRRLRIFQQKGPR